VVASAVAALTCALTCSIGRRDGPQTGLVARSSVLVIDRLSGSRSDGRGVMTPVSSGCAPAPPRRSFAASAAILRL
jgi:hypothetical protein